jgi:hypothetical protein
MLAEYWWKTLNEKDKFEHLGVNESCTKGCKTWEGRVLNVLISVRIRVLGGLL